VLSADRRYVLGCGALFVIYITALFVALALPEQDAQVPEIGLVNYLWPMLTVLFSIPLLRLKAKPFVIPGALIGTAGIFLAVSQGHAGFWAGLRQNVLAGPAPYLTGLVAAVSWGLYSSLSRRWGGGATAGAVPLFMLATGVVLGAGRLVFGEVSVWSWRVVGELAVLTVAPNLAYIFWDAAMRRGNIVFVASCSYFTPLLSTLVSCFYLGVAPTAQLWAGCALIILGAATCKMSVEEPADGVEDDGGKA
jgi:drug/metabolite transporter (DMT)-like permease